MSSSPTENALLRVWEEKAFPHKSTVLWRYLDLYKFKAFLTDGSLYFASARQFNDPFEGAITISAQARRRASGTDRYLIKRNPFEELRRITKINCWHMNEGESAAMWSLYLREGKGIAVRSTIGRLMDAIKPFRIKPEYGQETIWVGPVKYIDFRADPGDTSMHGRFFQKRRSFAHENEFRAIINLEQAEIFGGENIDDTGVLVPVDTRALIEAIYVAPGSPDDLLANTGQMLKGVGLNFPIHRSEMDDEAIY